MRCRFGAGNTGAAFFYFWPFRVVSPGRPFLFVAVQGDQKIAAVLQAVIPAGDLADLADEGVVVRQFVKITGKVGGQVADLLATPADRVSGRALVGEVFKNDGFTGTKVCQDLLSAAAVSVSEADARDFRVNFTDDHVLLQETIPFCQGCLAFDPILFGAVIGAVGRLWNELLLRDQRGGLFLLAAEVQRGTDRDDPEGQGEDTDAQEPTEGGAAFLLVLQQLILRSVNINFHARIPLRSCLHYARLFYFSTIADCLRRDSAIFCHHRKEVTDMKKAYKEAIERMLKNIHDEERLRLIYKYIVYLYTRKS